MIPSRSSAMMPKPTKALLNIPSCTRMPGTNSSRPVASVPNDFETCENTGPKKQPASYEAITAVIGVALEDTGFLYDLVTELDAVSKILQPRLSEVPCKRKRYQRPDAYKDKEFF